MDSQVLLKDYVEKGSELAFRELVARYTDLVYSTARRLTGGETQLAEDVAQTVFIDLARTARTLSSQVMLGGWLHRHTCFVAQNAIRTERRRQLRERRAAEMESLNNSSKTEFEEVAGLIDQAINQLQEEDRTAILLRFFEERDFRVIGQALGTTDDTAQKRVSRALEKLHAALGHPGITTLSAAALGAALSAEAVTAAPAGLAASLAGTALAAGAAGTATSLSLLKLAFMSKVKAGILGAVILGGVAAPLVVHHHAELKLRAKDEQLRQASDQLTQAAAENERLSNLLVKSSSDVPQSELNDLLRLRGEVGSLRRQLAEARRSSQKNATPPAAQPRDETEGQQKELAMARLDFPKYWMLAFTLYAAQNQAQCPTNFDQAAAFLPPEFTNRPGVVQEQFEIVYQGAFNTITNPQSIIVIREKEAVQGSDGAWHRAYGFADGHSELHRADNGDFGPWEAQHMLAPIRQ
ncbi:MAG TPA: sigma-70 family RNA polymerase sigma factor [Verrucomicrobiae bacterium]